MAENHRDISALRGVARAAPGVLLIALAALVLALNSGLSFSEGGRMGAGALPLACAVLLFVAGAVVLVSDLRNPAEEAELPPIPWRSIAMISAGVLVFALTIRTLGMALTAFLLVAVSALAAPDARLVGALVAAAVLTVFTVAVFAWGLGLYIPVLPGGAGF